MAAIYSRNTINFLLIRKKRPGNSNKLLSVNQTHTHIRSNEGPSDVSDICSGRVIFLGIGEMGGGAGGNEEERAKGPFGGEILERGNLGESRVKEIHPGRTAAPGRPTPLPLH